jgi:NADH:ubiquinone oxidoreductase subunit F (NADH-binding)
MDYKQILSKAEAEHGNRVEKPKVISNITELPSFDLENRIALRNCGVIDPDNINDYIVSGKGFSGLSRAMELGQEEVIKELRKSGLRGRGGGGYPTADKWQRCRDAGGSEKYIIGNTIDADPKACTARILTEGDPYAVLEGMLIGAYAVGAEKGYICINAEYGTAIKRINKALEQMRDYSLLGENILDSTFGCDIEIKEIESSLVAGEETALIRVLEGKQMMPYLRTFYPAEKGIYDKPTLVNNVETLANVSAVFQNGPEIIAGTGTEKSRGTKVVTLCGDIAQQHTVEVPFGTTIRKLVEDIGGGVAGSKDIKAVQFGGPTGSYFAGDSFDTPISYEAMEEVGAIIGSGTIEVYSSDSCAVEMARDAMTYLQAESCGKCVFCREGTYQMVDILNDISDNKGKEEDLDLINEIAEGMKIGSICGLGRTAPLPVLSSMKLFPGDYNAHIKEKKCGAAK